MTNGAKLTEVEVLVIGIPLGLFYSNAIEWVVHKHVLHGLGKRKGSWWSFHWSEHHKNCRRYGMEDPDYKKPLNDWNARGKEAAGVGLLAVVHLPLFPVAPFFTGTVLYSAVNYLIKHRRAHTDPEWASQHLPWHVEHHLGRDQEANWCVTRPWFDWVMRTRKHSEIRYPNRSIWRHLRPTGRQEEVVHVSRPSRPSPSAAPAPVAV